MLLKSNDPRNLAALNDTCDFYPTFTREHDTPPPMEIEAITTLHFSVFIQELETE